MKKSETAQFVRDLGGIVRLIHRERPGMFPLTIGKSLLASALPFVNIIFTGRLLDCLLAGGEGAMALAWQMIGLNFILGLGSKLLERRYLVEARTLHWQIREAIARKCLTMDYQQLETQSIMDKKERADWGTTSYGGAEAVVEYLAQLASHALTVLYAVLTVSRLFVKGTLPPDAPGWAAWLNSPWAALGILAIALAVPLTSIPLIGWCNRVTAACYDTLIDGSRRSSAFYRITSDYGLGKDIRTYALDGMTLAKCQRNMESMCRSLTAASIKADSIRGLAGMVNLLIVLAAYAFVGLKAMAGLVSVGSVAMQAGAITALAGAVRQAVEIIGYLDVRRKFFKEYAEFLAIPSEKYNGTLPVEKRDDGDYGLEFRDVGFCYPNQDQWSLRHVSCVLPKGQRLAIVGPNGAGKTTFIKLLCRLYDPTEGEILLNGIDIRKYDYGEYLSLLSVVFQDFKLFSMKLGENVAASADYDARRVWECLEKAGLSRRVEELADGLETGVYQQREGGVELSGGEGQKLAIARALYKDAPVIILDEPTAALDPVSEYDIYSRFGQMAEGRTSVYISHRMSSCRFCDLVYVFDGGAIVQAGTHEELLAREEGLYARLWRAQAQYYEAGTPMHESLRD